MAEIQENPVRNSRPQALEIECPDCGGVGAQTYKGAVFQCETCRGKGASPTEFGKDVLRFLAKFGCETAE